MATCVVLKSMNGGGENVPGILDACATHNFTVIARIWQEAHERDLTLAITLPVDILAPNGAINRLSTDIILVIKFDLSSSQYLWLSKSL